MFKVITKKSDFVTLAQKGIVALADTNPVTQKTNYVFLTKNTDIISHLFEGEDVCLNELFNTQVFFNLLSKNTMEVNLNYFRGTCFSVVMTGQPTITEDEATPEEDISELSTEEIRKLISELEEVEEVIAFTENGFIFEKTDGETYSVDYDGVDKETGEVVIETNLNRFASNKPEDEVLISYGTIFLSREEGAIFETDIPQDKKVQTKDKLHYVKSLPCAVTIYKDKIQSINLVKFVELTDEEKKELKEGK